MSDAVVTAVLDGRVVRPPGPAFDLRPPVPAFDLASHTGSARLLVTVADVAEPALGGHIVRSQRRYVGHLFQRLRHTARNDAQTAEGPVGQTGNDLPM